MRHSDYVKAGAMGLDGTIIYSDDCTADAILQQMGIRSLRTHVTRPFQQRDRNGIVYGPICSNSKPKRFR